MALKLLRTGVCRMRYASPGTVVLVSAAQRGAGARDLLFLDNRRLYLYLYLYLYLLCRPFFLVVDMTVGICCWPFVVVIDGRGGGGGGRQRRRRRVGGDLKTSTMDHGTCTPNSYQQADGLAMKDFSCRVGFSIQYVLLLLLLSLFHWNVWLTTVNTKPPCPFLRIRICRRT